MSGILYLILVNVTISHQSYLFVIQIMHELKTWHMHLQWIPGSLAPRSPHAITRESGYKVNIYITLEMAVIIIGKKYI